MTDRELSIDYGELIKQIDAVLESNMPKSYKSGTYSLLAYLRDLLDEYNGEEIIIRKAR